MYAGLKNPVVALLAAVSATVIAVVLSSCGTALTTNNFSVTVIDVTTGEPATTQVSVFDSQMGSSAEWAAKSVGTATATVPYTTSFQTTATKVIGDSGPGTQVRAGIAFPLTIPKGYFALTLTPVDGQTTTVNAPFVGYYDYDPEVDGSVAPISLEIASRSADHTWTLSVRAAIPLSGSYLGFAPSD
ncbi:MAG: hypothetical protein WA988_19815 [Candidatus Nanopelagicales bacterium]